MTKYTNGDRDFKPIWEQRENETEKNYSRFLDYLRMEKRNISKLAESYGVTGAYLRGIASTPRGDWMRRAAAYDRAVQAEIEQKTKTLVIEAAADTAANSRWLDEHEKMQLQLWEFRNQLIDMVKTMLAQFKLGNKARSGTKSYITWEEITDKYGNVQRVKVKNFVRSSDADPHWTYGDTIRAIEMVDRLGQEVLNLPSEVISKLPELVYQLRRNGHDPAYFVQSTIDKLKAS